MKRRLNKVVFPVAGMGSRFLPATKASPKEMMPVVDKPLIQYAVEEAVGAGMTDMIFITGRNKRAIEDHFDTAYELESELESSGKSALLELVRSVQPADMMCSYVRQPRALGLGHAVLCAEHLVGEHPFAVLLADDLMVGRPGGPGVMAQMVDVYARTGASVLAVQEVPLDQVQRYGIVAGPLTDQGWVQVQRMIDHEKRNGIATAFGLHPEYSFGYWQDFAKTIIVSLILNAMPVFHAFGIPFVWRVEWDIVNQQFGAAIAIFGTVISATIALLIAVPLSFGVALFLTETCPVALRRPLGTAIELLAAVPSIIYGMFGLFLFAPLFAEYGQPALQSTLGQMPLIAPLFGGAMNGIGVLAAGLILSFMILPFIASVMRDVFAIVPPVLRESAYGMGCTTWEVVRHIVLPYTQKGVIGGVMLGLGRALGETMAVTFVIGNANRMPRQRPSIGSPTG